MASPKGNGSEMEATMEGAVVKRSPVQQMINAMSNDASFDDGSSFTGDDIVGILSAESVEDMFEADLQGPLGLRDLDGCELAVYDVNVKFGRGNDESIKTMFTDEDGRQMYVIVSAARISDAGNRKDRILPTVGETFQFNTSARFALAKLWWLRTHGYVGDGKSFEVTVEATDLGGGQSVIKLKPVPQRTR